jgi:hypothetical protein
VGCRLPPASGSLAELDQQQGNARRNAARCWAQWRGASPAKDRGRVPPGVRIGSLAGSPLSRPSFALCFRTSLHRMSHSFMPYQQA